MPQGNSLVVRLRVDGILHEVERIPNEHASGVISRLKDLEPDWQMLPWPD